MSKIQPVFDPFKGLSKKAKEFDPFARHDGPIPSEMEIIGSLQARIAHLEEIADVKTADRIISHLRFSRNRLEAMLDLAIEEIDGIRAERDAALDDLARQRESFHQFVRLKNAECQKLESALDHALDHISLEGLHG